MSHRRSFARQLPASLPSRRRRRPGAAVARVDALAGSRRKARRLRRPARPARRPPDRRCGWASCSSRTASSRRTGGPRAPARRWSWAPAWRRCCRTARTWSSSAACSASPRFVSTSPHLGRMNLLSGAPISLDPNVIRAGTTMDQVVANAIGDKTSIPSLVLGVEPNELRLEDGLSMIYGSSLSWVTPSKPATKEIYPSRAFDRLVGDGTGRAPRSQHPRRRPVRIGRPQAARQPRRSPQAERVLRRHPRHREADRARRQGRAPRRLAPDASTSRTCRGRRTSCRRTSRIT